MVQLYSRVFRSLALPISTMPRFIIPLADKLDSSIGGMPATFTRNSTATYIDANGVLQTAGIDVIRFQNGRYLCEPAGTNKFLQSGDFSLDITDADNLVSDPVHGGPFSNVNSNLIDLTSGTQYIFKTVALTAGTYCFSQYVKLGTAASVGYGIYSVTAAAWITTQTHYTGLSTDLFTRVFNTFTLESNQTVRIYVKRYIDASSLGTSYHFGGQVESGIVPTSYIPTTTVPMDRVADALHYAVGDVITQGQGSLYCEFWNGNYAGTTRRILNISDGTNSNRIYPYIKDIGGVAVIGVTAGSTVINIGVGTVLSTLNKLLLSYKINSVNMYLNGILVGLDTVCTTPMNFTTLSIGCSHDGTLQLNSEIGNIKYFKEVLTPAEAIKLTTV